MNQILLFIGLVIILCLTIKPVGKKLPFPTLLIFIALGMLLGVNGPAHIDFSDYALTETVCSTALLFIMFYGGFNTNIDRAKPVAAPAVLLSTLGVVITAGITGVFAHFVLGFDWIGGLLLGSVVASTDAASVFSVLREHSLSLRGGTDSLLEVESGSNDPVAYMLTAVLATLAAGGDINIPALLAKQIILGVGLGLVIGWAAGRLIERAHATAEGAQTIFLFAVAIVAYALPSYLGGNGFLAVYLAGIVLGASDITGKVEMAHFFDTLTEMAEMTIFFLLGLLVTPARLPQMLLPGLALMAFMLFVSRPIAVGLLLVPFKTNPRQVALVSWAGLPGAASVVFSLFAVVAGVPGGHDLFDLVFVIAVSSIVVQGSLLPAVAKKLDMIDAEGDVRRTFNDYRDEDGMSFVKLKIGAGHPFAGRSLADIGSATDMLVVLVLRDGAHPVLPNGDTVIEEGGACRDYAARGHRNAPWTSGRSAPARRAAGQAPLYRRDAQARRPNHHPRRQHPHIRRRRSRHRHAGVVAARPKLAAPIPLQLLAVTHGKVAEVEALAFGSGQELLGRLVLDIHHVEQGGGKVHAGRTPRAIEQALVQLTYIDIDFNAAASHRVTAVD